MSVAVVAATEGRSFCDAMAGVGARGIRIANEVKRIELVTLVDFNAGALDLARRSAKLNGIARKCEFSKRETSAYLYSRYGRERRFDYVDLDPFGTPIRQLQAALCATADGGMLSVTATDTAVLCGVYPKVAARRYGALSLNNNFSHETGIRILFGAMAREGASLDIGIEPVAAHSTRHYVRVFVRVAVGSTGAERTMTHMGFVVWCPACREVRDSSGPERACGKCGARARVAGPLWAGPLTDAETVRGARSRAAKMGLGSAHALLGSLTGVDEFPPWSFDIAEVCSNLGIPSVGEEEVFAGLKERGFRTMKAPFEKRGIKTEAPYGDLVSAVKAAA